jgi:hypothetical protein
VSIGDLVVALHLDRVELLGAGDLLGRVGEPAHRAQPVAGDGPAGERGGDDPDRAEQEHHQAELVERGLVGLQRLRHHEGDAVLAGGHGRDPVVDAVGGLDGAAGVVRRPAGHRELRRAGRHGRAVRPLGHQRAAVGERVADRAVGGALQERGDGAHGDLRGAVGRGGVRPPVQRLVERGEDLVPHGEVRREGDQRDGDADRDRGEQDDPAGQGPPVAQVAERGLHGAALTPG